MALLLSTALFGSEDRASVARDFYTADEIKQSITSSKNYRLDNSDPASATALLFFDTRFQRTWLVKTARRLYCILDDVRKPAPHINWSMSMDDVVKDGNVKLDIVAHIDTSNSATSGKVDFGPKKDWLFSTKLFTVRSVEDEIRAFLLT